MKLGCRWEERSKRMEVKFRSENLKSYELVVRWNWSSRHTWITTSMRYSWAIASLQLTTCSRMLGRMTLWYKSRSTPSSWLSRTRFVPTRIRSSRRSISRFSWSREWPWCCKRTQSLFISIKLVRTKDIESWRPPAGLQNTASMRVSLFDERWTDLLAGAVGRWSLVCPLK